MYVWSSEIFASKIDSAIQERYQLPESNDGWRIKIPDVIALIGTSVPLAVDYRMSTGYYYVTSDKHVVKEDLGDVSLLPVDSEEAKKIIDQAEEQHGSGYVEGEMYHLKGHLWDAIEKACYEYAEARGEKRYFHGESCKAYINEYGLPLADELFLCEEMSAIYRRSRYEDGRGFNAYEENEMLSVTIPALKQRVYALAPKPDYFKK